MGQQGPNSSRDSHRSSRSDDDELRTGPASDRRRAAFEARQRRESGASPSGGPDSPARSREQSKDSEPRQSRDSGPTSRQRFEPNRADRGPRRFDDRSDREKGGASTRRNTPNRRVSEEGGRERRFDDRSHDGRGGGRGGTSRDSRGRSGGGSYERDGRGERRGNNATGRNDDRDRRGSRSHDGDRRFSSRDGNRRPGDARGRGDNRGGGDGRRREAGGFQRQDRFDDRRPQRFDRPRDESSSQPMGAPDGVTAEPEIWIDEGVAPTSRTDRSAQRRGRRGPVNQRVSKSSSDTRRGDSYNSNSSHASSPARSSKKRARSDSTIVVDRAVLVGLTGNKERADKLARRIKRAASSFESEYYEDARRTLAPIVKEVPDFADLRELNGLVMYRLGRWRDVIRELEAFRQLSPGSTEQHPVLADAYRAIGRYFEVGELWEELRMASPSGELVDEGRIVMAGSLADQGKFSDAIQLLSKGFKLPKHAQDRHLRRGYVLADLYERVGDVPQARELFSRLARIDPNFFDVNDRLRNLN